MKTRLLIAAVIIVYSAISTMAAEHIELRVHTRDGGHVDYVVSDDMKVSLGENTLNVSTQNGSVTYSTAEFRSFSYHPGNLSTGLDVAGFNDRQRVVISGTNIYANGYANGSFVEIFNLKGVVVSSMTIRDGLNVIADTDALDQGVYVVTVNGKVALKFVVK